MPAEHNAKIAYSVAVTRNQINHVYPANHHCKVRFAGESITITYANDPEKPDSEWSVYKGKRRGRHYFLERDDHKGWTHLLLLGENTLVGWWNEPGEGEGLWLIEIATE